MRIIAVANQKGGVGKTTTTVNLAASLGATGRQVVVVDLDPQGNASQALGISRFSDSDGTTDIYDVLVDGVDLASVVQDTRTPNVSCVASSLDLAGAEVELVGLDQRENRLADALATARWDDDTVVLLDCPPSLGLLTVNALVAADELFVPIQAEFYALDGVSQLIRTMELIRNALNPRLTIGMVALTMVGPPTAGQTYVLDEVAAYFGDRLAKSMIPRDPAASSAPALGRTVSELNPTAPAALAYAELASELLANQPTKVEVKA